MRFLLTILVTLGVAASAIWGAENACATLARHVAAAVRADRERVLIIVEDSIVQNETCACEIVKAAIDAARADHGLVSQIVFTAASCSPGSASVVAECALAAAPGAADEVKWALERAFEGEPPPPIARSLSGEAPGPANEAANPAGGKSPAGTKSRESSPDSEITLTPVSIGGICFIVPGGASAGVIVEEITPPKSSPRRLPRPRLIIIRPPDATPASPSASPNT